VKEEFMNLPFLKFRGSPEQIGSAYGEQTKELIAHNLALYFNRFEDEAGVPRDEALRRAEKYIDVIRTCSPDYISMMQAIADSSGFPFIDIAALNVRYEILYSAYSMIGMGESARPGPASDCTAFAVSSDSSPDGHLRIGQNWDWIPGVKCVLMEFDLQSGEKALCLNEAGIAGGKIGLNSSGLGLLVNGLMSNLDDWSRLGEPFHVKTWKVLCSRSLDEAIEAVSAGPHPCSANFLIAQFSDGRPDDRGIADVEIYPGGQVTWRPASGFFVHANHFLDPDSIGIWQPFREDCLTTFNRYSRMKALLQKEHRGGETMSEEFLKGALRDHERKPDSICRHRNTALPESEQIRTVLSVLIDLTSRSMQVAPGPPCEERYSTYKLQD
jgi:isopenicillin-N N-acyltransferase-like protein